jgi:hypothetical protein
MFQYLVRFLKISLSGLTISNALDLPSVTAQSVPSIPTIRERGSYIGIGGAIGLDGNSTALGTGGLAILTKIGFSDNLSLHDATIVFGGSAPTSMIVLTADFPIRNNAGETIVSPFIGAGAMLRYSNGISLSPAISGGADLSLSKDFMGTVRFNAGFPNDRNADLGFLVGVGYKFGG